MTAGAWLTDTRATPIRAQQWWVLTTRLVTPSIKTGEVLSSIVAPAAFTASFYIPLKTVMTVIGTGFSSYAQFMMPIVILQACAFTAIGAAFRSATDAVSGLDRRFGSMPIGPLVPMAARMSGNVFRLLIAIAAALVCGHVIGFRFCLDAWHTLGFLAFSLLIGVVFTLGADVIGTAAKSPEATTQALVLPPLILGMLSTGLAPASQFPEWIQPFVRNQPVSQFVIALRALAGDTKANAGEVTWALMGPPLLWAGAIVVICLPLALRLSKRRA
ncbi:ABC-2 type transport system permease protein [Nocardia amikacinitolerans]|uniref:ABC-2 type transport system permease protein n=1 Tax=Nocardia amikacinitolerans TaxID=756689 RepID=A0A285L9F1_9NOCA|nr:ABC transporter permease [Nocardia amikacinitolerans]MCP2280348.1 ABC-2 type transport system permease protein [Nocardia amikacinitolerans]MCP2300008.1 ABC-2 type transport system permease protein [Nocardia amikacinitolerans]MCP2320764.1 ABC-2 type transport system permease protein [Nocardia amikacinitolerans]SNY81570.1 ABC-2 type transport system permease protein [Nocardia amikacinitolerans]